MRMLAIQRAMEATGDLPSGFGLEADQRTDPSDRERVENVRPPWQNAARRAD